VISEDSSLCQTNNDKCVTVAWSETTVPEGRARSCRFSQQFLPSYDRSDLCLLRQMKVKGKSREGMGSGSSTFRRLLVVI
jgi:hypothetical protein